MTALVPRTSRSSRRRALRRLSELYGSENDDPSDPIVRTFFEGLAFYEQILFEKHGKNVKAGRTRQKIKNKGVYQSLIDWSRAKGESDGFKACVAAGRPELTGEYIVVQYAHRFPEDVVDGARERLTLHDIALPSP